MEDKFHLNSNHHLKGVPKRNLREYRKLVKEINKKTQVLGLKKLTTYKGGLCKKTIFRHRKVKFKNPRGKKSANLTQIAHSGTEVRVTYGDLRAEWPGWEPQPLSSR